MLVAAYWIVRRIVKEVPLGPLRICFQQSKLIKLITRGNVLWQREMIVELMYLQLSLRNFVAYDHAMLPIV